jgi:hypothetical protein
MKDYRQRIKFMIAWIEAEYAEYYEMGTVQVIAQQKGDPSMHFLTTRETCCSIPE